MEIFLFSSSDTQTAQEIVKRWGISPAQCVAFGDGGNDIEMLQYCEYSYAMENAPQDVNQ